jgi:tripartite-type tricarboxylate transporter receptor subunit TctC
LRDERLACSCCARISSHRDDVTVLEVDHRHLGRFGGGLFALELTSLLQSIDQRDDMTMNHSVCVAWLVASAISAAAASPPDAGRWPEKAVRIVVAQPSNSGDDVVTRILAHKLHELLGQPFIVENRPGAGGVIGQKYVQKASPDGYTWLLAGGSMAGARYVNVAATYDVLQDFTPVSLLETSPFVMVVHHGVPAHSAMEFIRLARSQSGKMTFATFGRGGIPYWSALLFNSKAGINAVEVPYKAYGAALSDLRGKEVDYLFAPSAVAVQHRNELRPLAVTTLARSAALPMIPTLAESALPGFDMPAWRSIMGPRGVPDHIVRALNSALERALTLRDVQDRLHNLGSDAAPSSPAELRGRYLQWIRIFGEIAQQADIRPQ